MKLRNLILLISIWVIWVNSTLYANIEVLARFEPSHIAVGNTSKYIVEITESSANSMPTMERITSMPIPQVNSLTLRNGNPSISRQTNILNGRIEYSITQQLIIDAIPESTGNYTLPSYYFEYKGNRLQVPATTLNVVKRTENSAPTMNEMVFIKLETPKQLYVGQTVLVTLKLHVSDNVQLRGLNSFERDADSFTVIGGPPEEAVQSIEIVNGRRYNTYSWPLKITPIRAGKQAFNFEIGVIGHRPSQKSSRDSAFRNSLFDNFFGQTERLNVYSKPTEINVLALPIENQPERFSGAIGQFNLQVNTDSKSTRVGEPIMLSLKLSGQGNFGRIQGPELPKTENWRTYPPESVFESDESQPLVGTKRFDYVFIPEKSGILELPEVSFSFFDPEVEKYVELTSPAIAVEVTPSERPVIPVPASGNTLTKDTVEPSADLVKSISPEKLLLTLDYRPKFRQRAPKYSISKTLFYGINASFFVIFLGAVILIYRQRRLVNNPDYQLVRDAKEELKSALKEIQSNDSATFFSAAQKAMRLAATIRLKQNLRTANFDLLESQFRQLILDETMIDQACALFQSAETHRFSGKRTATAADLSEYRRQLKTVLKAL